MKTFNMTFQLGKNTRVAVNASDVYEGKQKAKEEAFKNRINCMPNQIKLVSITNAF